MSPPFDILEHVLASALERESKKREWFSPSQSYADGGVGFAKGSRTSKEAAATLDEHWRESIKRSICDTIRLHLGGLAYWEVAQRFESSGSPVDHASLSGRFTELHQAPDGRLIDSGTVRINPKTDKPQIVWRIRTKDDPPPRKKPAWEDKARLAGWTPPEGWDKR